MKVTVEEEVNYSYQLYGSHGPGLDVRKNFSLISIFNDAVRWRTH